MVGIDTNIFIYYFNQYPQFGEISKEIIDKLTNGNLSGITSEITVIEILSHPVLSKKNSQEMDQQFLSIPNLIVLEVNHGIALEAAKIRRKYNFRLPDAIQLATAKLNKAQAFISNDRRLKNFKELKILLLNEI